MHTGLHSSRPYIEQQLIVAEPLTGSCMCNCRAMCEVHSCNRPKVSEPPPPQVSHTCIVEFRPDKACLMLYKTFPARPDSLLISACAVFVSIGTPSLARVGCSRRNVHVHHRQQSGQAAAGRANLHDQAAAAGRTSHP